MTSYYGRLLPLLAWGFALLLGTASSAPAQSTTDYDDNDNGLIDVTTLAQLNAIRWDLNGDGFLDTGTTTADTMAYQAAFPNAATGMGCPSSGCAGYELRANLDFDTTGDDDIADAPYANWTAIGPSYPNPYTSEFKGNNHTISNLTISGVTTFDRMGLFGQLSFTATISGVGLVDVNINAMVPHGTHIGALVGWNRGGTVHSSYATGSISVTSARPNWGNLHLGGLVGTNDPGTIAASWSSVDVSASGDQTIEAGGLVGRFIEGTGDASIIASYATGSVSATASPSFMDSRGAFAGGLVGIASGTLEIARITASYATGHVSASSTRTGNPGGVFVNGLIGHRNLITVTASYWDTGTTSIADDSDLTPPEGKTTSELQSVTSYTGIYANWNVDVDGTAGNDDPWTFGKSDQYPVLKYVGMDTTAQYSAQPQGVPTGVTVTALVDTLAVNWTAASNADGYKVQWKSGTQNYPTSDQQASTHGQTTISGGSTTTYKIPGLTAGTTYTVRVIATKTGGSDSAPSAEQTGVPKNTPPGMPTGVMVTAQVVALRVTWTAGANADGYKVQWKSGGQAYDAVAREYAVVGRDTTITGLTAGTIYTVRVIATRNNADDGSASSEETGTPLALPTLSIGTPSVAEGAAGATATLSFAVTLSYASQHEVTVAYADAGTGSATSGTDYTALAAGTLTFSPGATSQSLAVSVTGDDTDEPDETVVVTLSNPTNATLGTANGTGTITDDDPAVATLVLSPASISENGGVTTVTATLSTPESAAVTITVSAMAVAPSVSGDFTLSSATTLTIAAGQTTSLGTVTIRANDNAVVAATKSVTVSGTADDTPDIVAAPSDVTLMITDDDAPQMTLALSPQSISENGGVTTVTATLDRPASAAVTITVSAMAVPPSVSGDFTLSSATTLTIAAGQTTSMGTVTIRANDNAVVAAPKSVTVSGTADDTPDIVAAPSDVTLTITDDDAPQMTLALSPQSISENGGVTTVTATLDRPASAAVTITVSAMAVPPSVSGDFTLSSATTLTIAAGQTTSMGTVTIRANDNAVVAATKSVTVSGTADDTPDIVAAPSDVTLTITDDDAPQMTLALSPQSISENGGVTTVTATLDRPASAAVTITVSAMAVAPSVSGDFTLSSATTLTIAAGQMTSMGTVTIRANDNAVVAATKSVTVSGTADDTPDIVAAPSDVTLMITDDDAPQVTLALSPQSISENGGVTTVTATLDRPASAAVTITVSAMAVPPSVSGDFTLSSATTLTIAAGQTTSLGTVTIRANDNAVVAATKSVTVSGTADDTPDIVAAPSDVTLTITDDDIAGNIPADDPDVATSVPSFTDAVDFQRYQQGTPITPVIFPTVTDGDGKLTYSLPDLPPGLTYTAPGDEDKHSGILSGTPTEPQAKTRYNLTVTDEDQDEGSASFFIVIDRDLLPSFGDTTIAAQVYVQNREIETLTLPRATGGDSALAYALTPDLPAGLTFDAETFGVSGTPIKAMGEMTYTLTATDKDGDAATFAFTVAVMADLMPTFGDTSIAAQRYTIGIAVNLILPEATGGDGSLAYFIFPYLPEALSFDPTTRTLSGTPLEAIAEATYTLSALDADGDIVSLIFAMEVRLPSPDFDGNGQVNFADFIGFVGKYGTRLGEDGYDARYDLNGDGVIGADDFWIFDAAFGSAG